MRRMLSLLAVAIVLLSATTTAFAANGKVTYEGKAQQFIFAPGSQYSPTDLFPEFKDVMPGDTLRQKITVKNDASKKAKIKIYLRALGAHENSEEFLSKLRLLVKKSADNDMAYMFDAAASETAQLTDWVYLGTLYSGGKVNLEVLLDVPAELDNAYQKQVGYLDWEFKVEEFPIADTDPQPPKTGDDTQIGVWCAVMICALGAIIVLFVWRKKDEEKSKHS